MSNQSELIKINHVWSTLPRHNTCWPCKLDHAISFDPMIRFGNWKHRCDCLNLKIIFMVCNEGIDACNAKTNWCRQCKNKLMHVMQSWFLGYVDGHTSHSLWLNHGFKIECLQLVQNCMIWSSFWEIVKSGH